MTKKEVLQKIAISAGYFSRAFGNRVNMIKSLNKTPANKVIADNLLKKTKGQLSNMTTMAQKTGQGPLQKVIQRKAGTLPGFHPIRTGINTVAGVGLIGGGMALTGKMLNAQSNQATQGNGDEERRRKNQPQFMS